MKVWIDQDLCTGDGLCEEICPAVFTLLDDGLAYVKEGDDVMNDPGGAAGWSPSRAELEDAVTEAAEECPGECIFIETELAISPAPGAPSGPTASLAAVRGPLGEARALVGIGRLGRPRPAGTVSAPARRARAVGEEAGVGHHAVVGPHRAPLDVPGPPQHLEGLGERRSRWRRARARSSAVWLIVGR